MRVITTYECGLCGFRYETQEEAEKCERNHRTPVKIKRFAHSTKNSVYPERIVVEMSDGREIQYGNPRRIDSDFKE